ncbi:hypothetical protein KA005_53930 [bacterium]|nr:hypothetical protein [bacterium]
MNEIELIESTVSEYRKLSESKKMKPCGELDTDRIVSILSNNHDWTHQGAHAIVCLANEYGAFMLRNALALAIVLGREDGNLGF